MQPRGDACDLLSGRGKLCPLGGWGGWVRFRAAMCRHSFSSLSLSLNSLAHSLLAPSRFTIRVDRSNRLMEDTSGTHGRIPCSFRLSDCLFRRSWQGTPRPADHSDPHDGDGETCQCRIGVCVCAPGGQAGRCLPPRARVDDWTSQWPRVVQKELKKR